MVQCSLTFKVDKGTKLFRILCDSFHAKRQGGREHPIIMENCYGLFDPHAYGDMKGFGCGKWRIDITIRFGKPRKADGNVDIRVMKSAEEKTWTPGLRERKKVVFFRCGGNNVALSSEEYDDPKGH